jgi:hypothetical protein
MWYKGLALRAKSKKTGREFWVVDAYTTYHGGQRVKWYVLYEVSTQQEFRMPESEVELIKTNLGEQEDA